ncbi:MAG: hypothetical protein ABL907_11945 [Hyphomicrobium sp.]
MRNFDLDQFWPQFDPTLPRREGGTVAPARAQPHQAASEDVPDDFRSDASDAAQSDNDVDLLVDVIAGEMNTREPDGPEPIAPHIFSQQQVLAPPTLVGATATIRLGPLAQDDGTATTTAATGAPDVQEISSARPVERDAEPVAASTARRDKTPFIWGGLGFLAGALAWHVLGFWWFVSGVVLNTNDARRAAEISVPNLNASPGAAFTAQVAATKAPAATRSPATPPARINESALCVAVALDRNGGPALKGPCASTGSALRDAGFNRRADRLVLRPRLQDPAAWSGTTATSTEPVTQEASIEPADIGTLQPSDFKLEMDAKN